MRSVFDQLKLIRSAQDLQPVVHNVRSIFQEGIHFYKVKDIVSLGEVCTLIDRYLRILFKDPLVYKGFVRDISKAFFDVMKGRNHQAFIRILLFYPVSVLEALEAMAPSKEIKNLVFLKRMSDFFDEMETHPEKEDVVPAHEVEMKRQIDDILTEKRLNDIFNAARDETNVYERKMVTALERISDGLKEKRTTLQAEIDELKRLHLSGMFRQKYSDEQVAQWLDEIDDAGLLSFEGASFSSVEPAASKPEVPSPIKKTAGKEKIASQNQPPSETTIIKQSIPQATNTIDQVFETKKPSVFEKTEPDLAESSQQVESEAPIEKQIMDKPVASQTQVKSQVEPPVTHYDQEQVVREIKDKNKAGMSI